MSKFIIYDCDGVLLDWTNGFRSFLKDAEGIEADPAGPSQYNMMTWIGTDDRSFVIDLVNRFNSGEGDYFANLEAVPGAVRGVNILREAGYLDSVLTACNTDPKTVSGRKANLDRIFGGFEELTCIDLMASKRPHLSNTRPSWFVEDNRKNAQIGTETGHNVILIDYPHNSELLPDEKFLRKSSWTDIVKEILQVDVPLEASM